MHDKPTPKPRRIDGPEFEPISPEQAKMQLGFAETQNDWDDQLTQLIGTAREIVEADTGLVLGDSTFAYTLDRWPGSRHIRIPLRPVREIMSIVYVDALGGTQTWSPSNYRLDVSRSQPHIWLVGQSNLWPTTYDAESAITITLTAGYSTADDVPMIAKQLCLLQIGSLFRGREADTVGKMDGYDNLCRRLARSTYP